MKEGLLQERQKFHLELPADENNLSEVRDFIADICRRAGFSKRETNNTKLAMDEACTNIIKHAYRNTAGNITIDVDAEPGKLDISVFDQGKTFEWSKIKDPDLQKYVEIGKKGGLGIYLMNRLMDDLKYESSEIGNRLQMTKISESVSGISKEPIFEAIKLKWSSTLRFKFALRATIGLLGLMLFIWGSQYVNQTREIESQRRQVWTNMDNLARTLESKSETAMVLDDLYDPEYREISDFIQDRIIRLAPVKYARLINNDGVVVASSDIDEFQKPYADSEEMPLLTARGVWVKRAIEDLGEIEEYHLPITLAEGDHASNIILGRVILGVSRAELESDIEDMRLRMTMILAGIFIVGLSLIYLLISVFVKPIQDLTDGVRAIGEGALVDGIHIDGPEEIGAIAQAFNEITSKFREAQKNVVEQERLQKEMQVAQEIQHSLLPGRVPKISGYDIASLYRAAKEVGGDYYDFVNVGEDSLGVVVADVSGKGVPGSLVMTMIRTALRMEARGSLSAAEVMSRMNDFVTEDMKKGMFVTIFYVILDSKNRIISYASAGHNPMILFRAETDETFFLNPRGFPVGISLPDDTLFRRSIDVEKIKLKKDDMLVIYTDGVTEAMNEQREQYGEDRLLRIIKENGRLTPDEFIDGLNGDIKEFTGDYPQNDDITVVAIKEKLMADDVLFGIRKRLLDLVDIDGFTVAEACARMKVSPSTYYRYKKRLAELGERGLKNKTLRKEHEIRRVSIEQRKQILSIIRENPNFGAKRIATIFNEDKDSKDELSPSLVYEELKRMRLNTYEKRLEYLRRNKFISEQQYQSMLSAPAAGVRQAPEPVIEEALPPAVFEEEEVEEVSAASEAAVEELAATAGIRRDDEAVEEEKEPVEAEEEKPITLSHYESPAPADAEYEDINKALEEVLGAEMAEEGVLNISPEDRGDGIVVLNIEGHLDSSSAADLEGVLESVYEYGCRKIILDLREVSYISSGGWGIFTGRVKSLREGEGDVVLCGMSPEVYDIYELLGFRDIIMQFQTVGEAVEYLSMPFAMRKNRLEEMSRMPAAHGTIEHRVSAGGGLSAVEEEEVSAFSPLNIVAGTVGESGEITVLNLNGVIDTVSCMKLEDVMDSLIEKGSTRLVVDMSRVEYVSSAGWGVFASRIDELRAKNGDIKIFGMDPEVDSIFHLLGFDVIMKSFSILSEAIEDFNREPYEAVGEAYDAPEDVSVESERSSNRSITDREVEDLRSALKLEASSLESPDGESIVLHLGGAIDAATTVELEKILDLSIEKTPKYMIIDLSDVVYISSSGWGVIVKHMQQLGENSGRMALTGMSPAIFKIFRDLGFEPLILHFLSVEKALDMLSAPGLDQHGSRVKAETPEPATAGVDKTAGPAREEASAAVRTDLQEQAVGDEEPLRPSVDRSGVEPLGTQPREKGVVPDVVLDLDNHDQLERSEDKRIRNMGWKEYGKKLLKKNRKEKKK